MALLVHDEKGILTHENLDLIERMSDELWKVDEVLRVDTLITLFIWKALMI